MSPFLIGWEDGVDEWCKYWVCRVKERLLLLLLLVVKEEEAKAAMVRLEMIEQPGFSFSSVVIF